MTHLDSFGRPINYLRVSVTDRCNLRCLYCMPPEGIQQKDMSEILKFEEIEAIVRAAAELGVSKVRLTGGEPLVRLGIVDLVALLARVPGIDDLSMTTNGTLLADKAAALADAGLNRVNISLDSLIPERFVKLTRRGTLGDVLRGIEAAEVAGLTPVKINMVVVRGLNDDEIVTFAQMSRDRGWHIRYIEMMPLGADLHWQGDGIVSIQEIKETITRFLGPLTPCSIDKGNGPARYFRIEGAGEGTIGFISPVTEHFCNECNRLRLTADGRLRPCLLSEIELDLRSILRSNADPEAIQALLKEAIQLKPLRHRLHEHISPHGRTMSQIGG